MTSKPPSYSYITYLCISIKAKTNNQVGHPTTTHPFTMVILGWILSLGLGLENLLSPHVITFASSPPFETTPFYVSPPPPPLLVQSRLVTEALFLPHTQHTSKTHTNPPFPEAYSMNYYQMKLQQNTKLYKEIRTNFEEQPHTIF